MVMGKRAFIESAIAEVREAKDLVLPLLMVQEPEDPVTAASLRALWGQCETLDPVMRKTLALLMAYELPFIEEEARLEAEGLTLETDMAAFEVAMVDFERHFWEAAYVEYTADPERFSLHSREEYDLCPQHKLSTPGVRAAIDRHASDDFDDIARYLGTSRACPECHRGVTRLLIQAVKRAKDHAGA
jgi:bacterioferritin-associated ferredoxin